MAKVVPGQPHDRTALILYGSETGNSEEVAECLGVIVQRFRFLYKVCEMDAVELSLLSKATVVVFVISTTGLGDIPRNARKFWRSLLRKRLPPDCLSHVSFTTFGLGDSSYVQFNWAARKLHKRLEQLGATEIYPRGEGDEQHHEGIDGTYLSWSTDFGKRLLSLYPLPEGVEPIPPRMPLPPKYILRLVEEKNQKFKDSFEQLEPEVKDSNSESGSLLGTDADADAAIQKAVVLAYSSGKTTSSGSLRSPATTPQLQPQPSVLAIATRLQATTPDPTSISTADSLLLSASTTPDPTSISTADSLLLSASTTLGSSAESTNLPPISSTSFQDSVGEPANLSTSTSILHQPRTSIKASINNSVNMARDLYNITFTPGYFLLDEDEPYPRDQFKYGVRCEDQVDRETPNDRVRVPFPGAQGVSLVETKRMTPENHWQEVRQLTFRLPAVEGGRPMPGDILIIHPRNFPDDVEALIQWNGWQDVADKEIEFELYELPLPDTVWLSKISGLYPIQKATIRDLLTYNLDITAIPTRRFFDRIWLYTKDPRDSERLEEFGNPAHSEEFYNYTSRSRRSIWEILKDFPSVKIPWKSILSVFPLIQGRKYSICSGGDLTYEEDHPGFHRVQVLVALVKYRTVLQQIRRGLCSRYIKSLTGGEIVDVSFERGTVGVGSNPERPAILIGPGTGIAPLRSLIWERARAREKNDDDEVNTVLFYGGRNRDIDYFYEDEWLGKKSHLTVFTAFSRDQPAQIYVQQRIEEQGRLIWKMLSKDACIWVCGSAGRMPKAVREAIVEVMVKWGNLKLEEAEKRLADMVKKRLYTQETW